MTMISAIAKGRCDAMVDSLRAEFGAVLTARILEAEAMDFLWGASVSERYLGQHVDLETRIDDHVPELSRVAILSVLDGWWHCAACLVDGEGQAVELLWKQAHDGSEQALAAFQSAV